MTSVPKYQTTWEEKKDSATARLGAHQFTYFGFIVDGARNSVVWHHENPSESFQLNWDKEYNVFAADMTITDGEEVFVNGDTPAVPGFIYEWNGSYFNQHGPTEKKESYGIKNISSASYSFGIQMKSPLGSFVPICIDTLEPGQSGNFTPIEAIYAVMCTNHTTNSIITHVSSLNTMKIDTTKPYAFVFDDSQSAWVLNPSTNTEAKTPTP